MATRNKDKTALVPGSYDPVTIGHLYLIDRAAKKYGKVIAGIFVNPEKEYFFDLDKRLEMLRAVCAKYENVRVDSDPGMLWQYAQRNGVTVSVRGYRNEKDLAYEREAAAFNSNALPVLKTELIRCPKALRTISSTAVRAALSRGETPEKDLPPEVLPLLESYRKTADEK